MKTTAEQRNKFREGAFLTNGGVLTTIEGLCDDVSELDNIRKLAQSAVNQFFQSPRDAAATTRAMCDLSAALECNIVPPELNQALSNHYAVVLTRKNICTFCGKRLMSGHICPSAPTNRTQENT